MAHNDRYQTAAFAFLSLVGSTAVSNQLGNHTDKWLAVLIALLLALPVYVGVGYLLKQRRRILFLRRGSGTAAELWRLFPALWSISFAVILVVSSSQMWSEWAMSQRPDWLYVLLLSVTVLLMASQGSQAILRAGVLIAVLLPFFMVTDSLFLIPELEGNPFTYSGAEKLLPLVGKLFLLLIAPVPILLWYGSLGKGSMAPLMVGFFTGGVYLFWQSLRDSMALGQLTNLERWPLLRTLSLASAGPGLERVEYLGLMVLVGGGLFVAAALVSAAKEMIEAI